MVVVGVVGVSAGVVYGGEHVMVCAVRCEFGSEFGDEMGVVGCGGLRSRRARCGRRDASTGRWISVDRGLTQSIDKGELIRVVCVWVGLWVVCFRDGVWATSAETSQQLSEEISSAHIHCCLVRLP